MDLRKCSDTSWKCKKSSTGKKIVAKGLQQMLGVLEGCNRLFSKKWTTKSFVPWPLWGCFMAILTVEVARASNRRWAARSTLLPSAAYEAIWTSRSRKPEIISHKYCRRSSAQRFSGIDSAATIIVGIFGSGT
jgi:hypothetical protein